MKTLPIGTVVICMTVTVMPAQQNPSVPMTKYTDAANGVSLEYPKVWKRVIAAEAYCRPAAFPDDGKPAVQFGVEFTGKGNSYEKTGLEALVFLFGTEKNISEDECDAIAKNIPEAVDDPASRGDVQSYYEYRRGGKCGLNHRMDAKVYTRFSGDRCYVFEEDFDRYGGASDGMRDLTADEKKNLQRHLDGIMESVKIQSTMLPRSWATTIYQDKATGVSFQYPAALREREDIAADFSPGLPTIKEITFHAKLAYEPPVGPRVEEASTDLGYLAFLFATKRVVSADACYKLIEGLSQDDQSSPTQTHVDINGVAFHVEYAGDAGASHFVDSKLYATYRGGTCYLFEQAITGLDGYAGDVTHDQWKDIGAHMDAIASTIRFGEPSK